jgi:putative transposase
MWPKENRGKYNRDGLRYPSELTNAEWGAARAFDPACQASSRRREVDVREVLNGIEYATMSSLKYSSEGDRP